MKSLKNSCDPHIVALLTNFSEITAPRYPQPTKTPLYKSQSTHLSQQLLHQKNMNAWIDVLLCLRLHSRVHIQIMPLLHL